MTCIHERTISRTQSKKGFAKCSIKDKNIHRNECEGCKDYEDIMKGIFNKRVSEV